MKIEQAVFGGGCFWCTEAIFKMLKGVESVTPGYTGGTVPNPTYEQVCTGDTGHAEAVRIEYDSSLVSFENLMTVFFGTHDPTTKNRQGNDVGTQYRSAIFYSTDSQKVEAEKFIVELNARPGGAPIVTEVSPLTIFYPAEDYHKDYFSNHSYAPYCQLVINPKLEKVQQKFASLLKDAENKKNI
jgi:peptide-methionine (S)-S-oxide reductase